MMRKCYNNKCGKIIKTKTDAVYVFCCVKCAEDSGFKNFHPKSNWTPGYSAFELEKIAKLMRKMEE